MRVLFLGDIVGRAARQKVIETLPELRAEFACDAVIVNCENAAGGFGVTPAICDDLFAAGTDVLTTGNHVWDKAEITPYIQNQPRLLRPANMAREFPGQGHVIHQLPDGRRLGVINVMCNLFMAENDNMFAALDKALEAMQLGRDADFIFCGMSMARPHLKKWRQVYFAMGAPQRLWAHIRIFQQLICIFWQGALLIKQMPACVVIINLLLACQQMWR